MSDLRYTVTVTAERNMGDHAERVSTQHDTIEGETVDAMLRRCFPELFERWRRHDPTTTLTLQVTSEQVDELQDAAEEAGL